MMPISSVKNTSLEESRFLGIKILEMSTLLLMSWEIILGFIWFGRGQNTE